MQRLSQHGIIAGITSVRVKKEGVDGSGVLARIEFKIWDEGTAKFSIRNSSLLDPLGNVVLATPEDTSATVVASPAWDVNKDYVVDISDLVILGLHFGESVSGKPRPNPDVKPDGIVNIFDLVLIGAHFGDEYSTAPQPPAAPAIVSVGRELHRLPSPTVSQLSILGQLYERLKAYPDDPSFTAVKQLLANLLQRTTSVLPKTTAVAQNYPNPFNPETWIPYQLAQDAHVVISIYNAKGQIIRTIALNNKKAGFYITKDKAAYWDGKDHLGQSVASGVYFYKLQTGSFTSWGG